MTEAELLQGVFERQAYFARHSLNAFTSKPRTWPERIEFNNRSPVKILHESAHKIVTTEWGIDNNVRLKQPPWTGVLRNEYDQIVLTRDQARELGELLIEITA